MATDLRRRLARVEAAEGGGLFLVPVFPGQSRDDALVLRFGDAGAPIGAELVLVQNALPPDSVPYFWSSHPEDPLFQEHWNACRADILATEKHRGVL